MPLEDKDHQGGTQVCTSNEHYLVNQDLRKLRKGDDGRAYNFPHSHLLDQILQRKKKQNARRGLCLRDLKSRALSNSVKWQKSSSLGEEG